MRFAVKDVPTRHVYNFINGLVAPRPIALVTTLSPEGRLNAAPFSAYNYLCINPPILGIGVSARPNGNTTLKDTARNIELTQEFVVNVVTEDIGEKMNICGVDFPSDISELDMAGFTTAPSLLVKPPRIKEAHAAMECRLWQTLQPGTTGARIILGEVIAIYTDEEFIDPKGPYVIAEELHAIGRMNGLSHYVHTRDAFMNITRMNYEEWKKNNPA